jgi:Fe2+ or Zn2+ uptake regulation protein
MARKPRISIAIAKLMTRNEHHAWTLEDLHAGLASAGIATDFSSVFRAAEKLVAEGEIRKLQVEDGKTYFERVSAHHDHLHCTRCGELVAIPCVVPRRTLAALESKTGVTITAHQVSFVGLCADCRIAAEC